MEPSEAENWRPVPGCEGRYEVSDLGRVRSWARPNGPHVLKPSLIDARYLGVRLGRRRQTRVSHAVLMAFVGPRPVGYEAAHLDGNPLNNRLGNLAWTTHSENELHKRAHGTSKQGERHHDAKLTESEAAEVRRLFNEGQLYAREIAALFGISATTVFRIGKGEGWAHLGGTGPRKDVRTKVTPAQADEIRQLFAEGTLQPEIARRYGITQQYVSDICRRRKRKRKHG